MSRVRKRRPPHERPLGDGLLCWNALLGARRHDPPPSPGCPPAEVVHRIHDRYLVEIVEELGLCPFARRSRELGRVHRPLHWCDGDRPRATEVAAALASLVRTHEDAEIVLLTFLGDDPRLASPRALDELVAEIREAYGELHAPVFFMVGFHPKSGAPVPGEPAPALTRDSLVPLLRRSPDPVIQCVRAEVLERVRAQAQRTAHERMIAELTAIDPAMAAIAKNSVHPDSELSADIARHNFSAVATGEGRAELERRLTAIASDRAEAYALAAPSEATV